MFILASNYEDDRITTKTGLPFNTESFRTIQINRFVMKDTLTFMPYSLDALVYNILIINN